MSKIINTKDMDLDYAKVVLYGPPGAGKTTAAATWPKPLFLSAEGGLLSIRDRDIDVWPIDGWPDIEEAFAFLCKGGHGYKSVVLDSITELQKKLNEHIVAKFPGKRRDYEDLMSMSDWGYSMDKMRKCCRAFRDLPLNVVFIALDQTDDNDGLVVVKPALSGKTLSTELCGWVDAVVYTPGPQKDEDGNQKYFGQTVAARGRMAKLRVPADTKPPAVIELTYEALAEAMGLAKQKGQK